MRDQADELRQLVRQRLTEHSAAVDDRPDGGVDGVPSATHVLPAASSTGDAHWQSQWHTGQTQGHTEQPRWHAHASRPAGFRKIVVSAGKGGVGTTTVAVNLAVSIARMGCRTILVDADLSGADATWLCGLESSESIADVLAGRRAIDEVLRPGPGGIQVVPGVWSPTTMPDCSPSGQLRLLRQLDQLERHADWVILDAGSGLNHVVRRFWEMADEVLLVTTGEAVAIMDTYAAIKLFLGEMPQALVQTVVNQSTSDAGAAAVHDRLETAARRFLGMTLAHAGSIPWDAAIATAAAAAKPLAHANAAAPAAKAVDQLAERLLAVSG